jgi:hypothetical protein
MPKHVPPYPLPPGYVEETHRIAGQIVERLKAEGQVHRAPVGKTHLGRMAAPVEIGEALPRLKNEGAR